MSSAPKPPISVHWIEAIQFEAKVPSGKPLRFDAAGDDHPDPVAVSPLEAFLASAAACSAMDVIGILVKKRQKVTAYRVDVSYERIREGDWPHPVTAITLDHVLEGEDLDEEAVRQAVKLSDEKYCTVVATLRATPTVNSVYTLTPRKSD